MATLHGCTHTRYGPQSASASQQSSNKSSQQESSLQELDIEMLREEILLIVQLRPIVVCRPQRQDSQAVNLSGVQSLYPPSSLPHYSLLSLSFLAYLILLIFSCCCLVNETGPRQEYQLPPRLSDNLILNSGETNNGSVSYYVGW